MVVHACNPSYSGGWDYRYLPPRPANSVFLVEMGFHQVSQAGLKHLTPGDPPASASQSAGITSMSHCSLPYTFSTYTCTHKKCILLV
uniref:Uncharacterized protein n=1 Tax=Callithrix jacchus TaxID=9483 RepID=A0A8I3WPD3_CALJA